MIPTFLGKPRRLQAARTFGARAALTLCLLLSAVARAEAPPPSYLNQKAIGAQVAPAPAVGSEPALTDLYLVRAAQRAASPGEWTEAFDDAKAYTAAEVLPRFNAAAGAEKWTLSETSRPIVAHMLAWVLTDADHYSDEAKKTPGAGRLRPYAETRLAALASEIRPCFEAFLPPDGSGSYPSGHAARGYAAALLLADVMPAKREALLARGALYGDSRVICGVHHPVDVERGRAIGRQVYEATAKEPAYQADLACAIEEAKGTSPAAYTPACRQRYLAYAREVFDRQTASLCALFATSSESDRPKSCQPRGNKTMAKDH
ncbi:MAG: phosphatase PAP2 family protein [Proteobacteria bacterium]|nr:phosphatase PAP2 family protein [Pseudomonadota bacterium]